MLILSSGRYIETWKRIDVKKMYPKISAGIPKQIHLFGLWERLPITKIISKK